MKPIQIALLVIVAVIGLVSIDSFYVLPEGQQAVVLQFGRPVGSAIKDPGLHFKLPVIQEVRRFE